MTRASQSFEPAPLVTIKEIGVPPGGTARFIAMRDGARIRVALWQRPQARASVVILPGATEFIEFCYETIGELLARGVCVGALDWRGQGLSHRPLADPRRRHIDDFSTYVEDFRELATGAFADLPRPWLMLCQSMGGNIALRILSARAAEAAGAILLAPMLAINTGAWPLPIARAIAGLGSSGRRGARYIPGGSGASTYPPFEGNPLTHDARRHAWINAFTSAEPRLDIGEPTLGWLDAAFRSMDVLARPDVARGIDVPALLFEAGEDAIVVNRAIGRIAGLMPRARLVRLDAARHAILLETDIVRGAFWREYDRFAAEVLGS